MSYTYTYTYLNIPHWAIFRKRFNNDNHYAHHKNSMPITEQNGHLFTQFSKMYMEHGADGASMENALTHAEKE